VSGSDAAATLTGIPSDPQSKFANEEWGINTQLRLGRPLASYYNQPHAPCPHGCRHPQTKEAVKVRYGYHLVTDQRQASRHLLSGITTIDNPTAKDWHLDVTSTNRLGATNQALMHRTPLGHQSVASGTTRATTPSSAPRKLRPASTLSTTNSARQQARSSSRSRSRRRAVTAPPRPRCTTSSPSTCATRVCRRTCCCASSRETSRSRYAGARSPK
jgi:hypothetical protein